MVEIDAFRDDDTEPLLRMWRTSFEFGVGIVDPHPLAEQRTFFREQVLPKHRVLVARAAGSVVGFVAFDGDTVSQLYVDPAHHGRGVGTRLLQHAKDASAGRLRLYTFQRNRRAQRFYEHHGFRVVARGFEPMWQLEDLLYEWQAAAAAPPAH